MSGEGRVSASRILSACDAHGSKERSVIEGKQRRPAFRRRVKIEPCILRHTERHRAGGWSIRRNMTKAYPGSTRLKQNKTPGDSRCFSTHLLLSACSGGLTGKPKVSPPRRRFLEVPVLPTNPACRGAIDWQACSIQKRAPIWSRGET